MAALKMDILPRILYLLQTLPVRIPLPFLSSLRSMCSKFLWSPGGPRIAHKVLIRRKELGGVGLPDFRLYYTATVCTRLMDFCYAPISKQWVQLECTLSPVHPAALPWVPPQLRPPGHRLPYVLRILLPTWDSIMVSRGLSSRPGPLTPLFSNPLFPEDSGVRALLGLPRDSRPRMYHAMVDGSLLPPPDSSTLSTSSFTYTRLRHFHSSLTPAALLSRPRTDFEKLCTLSSPPAHTVSLVYGVLRSEVEKGPRPSYISKWESDLGISLTDNELSKLFLLTHKTSLSSRSQEKNFKILSSWYRCPERIHEMFPSASALCWRCGRAVGSYVHIWWDCPLIAPFWTAVFDLYNVVCSTTLSISPACALMSHYQCSAPRAKKGLLRHFLSVARILIPRHWKSSEPPSKVEFVEVLNRVRRMEELVATDSDREESFAATWCSWDSFRESPEFSLWLS